MSVPVSTHVFVDERGVAWIDDTNTKVVEIVVERLAYGWSPEEIHFQHPHLSLAQIHAALAHYHDNQAELDAQIEHDVAEVDRLAAEGGETPLRKRLRAEGKLP